MGVLGVKIDGSEYPDSLDEHVYSLVDLWVHKAALKAKYNEVEEKIQEVYVACANATPDTSPEEVVNAVAKAVKEAVVTRLRKMSCAASKVPLTDEGLVEEAKKISDAVKGLPRG